MIIKEENKTEELINIENMANELLYGLMALHFTVEYYVETLKDNPEDADCYITDEDYPSFKSWLKGRGFYLEERPFIIYEGDNWGTFEICATVQEPVDYDRCYDTLKGISNINKYTHTFGDKEEINVATVELNPPVLDKQGNSYSRATFTETIAKDNSSVIVDFQP